MRKPPTPTIDFAIEFLFLGDALGKDFCFYQHIIKPFVFFLKSGVVSEEAINGLSRGGDITVLGHQAITHAEVVVLFLGADYLASHMPNAMDGDTIGEEPTIFAFGQVALRDV